MFFNRLRLPYSIPKSFALLLNIHLARHTCGTLLLNAGVDMLTVSKVLGHSSTKTTEAVYAKLLPETIMKRVEEVSDKLI